MIKELIPSLKFSVASILLGTIGGMMLSGCSSDRLPAYSEFVDIDPIAWYPGVSAELCPYPLDSAEIRSPYSMALAVRYTEGAPDSVRFVLTTESLVTESKIDTVSLKLRHPLSRPVGKGSFGIYTVTSPLTSHTQIPDGMRIAIEPVVRTPGIVSVGLILSKP